MPLLPTPGNFINGTTISVSKHDLRQLSEYRGWPMDALRAWMVSDLDVIMAGTLGWGTRMASEMDAGHPDGVGV